MTRNAESKSARIVAYLSSFAALATSILLFQERHFIGFPDGFVSEPDRARRVLLAAASGASLLAGFGFGALGWVGSSRLGRKVGVAALVYGVLLALALVADHSLSGLSGRGG